MLEWYVFIGCMAKTFKYSVTYEHFRNINEGEGKGGKKEEQQ